MCADVSRSRSTLCSRIHGWLGLLLLVCFVVSCASSNPQVYSQLSLEVQPSDMDAEVYVDGNYIGQLAEIQGKARGKIGALRLAPGVHRLEIRKPGTVAREL